MKQLMSGIPGLDEVLGGGLLTPSTVLVAGVAGTGKTTFAFQSIFYAAKKDETCMYVTALSEPIALTNSYMSRFGFYDISMLGKGNIRYVPLDPMQMDTSTIIGAIEKNIETIKPDRIVIDPVNVLTGRMDRYETRKFYYELFTKMKEWNSLVLVTAELSEDEIWKDELSYLVDGIIYLSNDSFVDQRVRHLEVLKLRGQLYLTGKQSYSITPDGLVIHPTFYPGKSQPVSNVRINTGIEELNKMTGGGLITGTNTMISGGSGTGKTLIALQFLVTGALTGEPGVFVSFEESPELLKSNAAAFGWDIEELEEKGLLKILYTSAYQMDMNENALAIKHLVEEIDAKRVVIDGVHGFRSAITDVDDTKKQVHILSRYFKHNGITSIFINDVPELTGSSTVSGNGTSLVMDTIILLRYVEIESGMKKAISILKMRGSNHDKGIRELVITDKGIKIEHPFTEYSGLMSGNPVKSPSQAFEEAFKK